MWLTIKTYLKSQYNIKQDWYFVVADEKLIDLIKIYEIGEIRGQVSKRS
jgi:hypothetical protein